LTNDALIFSDNYRFSLPINFLEFEDFYGASVDAGAFTVTFFQIDYYAYHLNHLF
jgi:hypothetical protein